jgi:phosphoribosylamine-glycine ligase
MKVLVVGAGGRFAPIADRFRELCAHPEPVAR